MRSSLRDIFERSSREAHPPLGRLPAAADGRCTDHNSREDYALRLSRRRDNGSPVGDGGAFSCVSGQNVQGTWGREQTVKKTIVAVLLATLMSVALGPAAAEEPALTGADIIRVYCEDKTPVGVALCKGYISGIAELMQVMPEARARFCPPEGAASRYAAIFLTFLRANPEQRNVNAAGVVAVALQDAFPCER
jgi:hypothetical protein